MTHNNNVMIKWNFRSCKNFNQCYECAKLGNSEAGIEPAPTCDGEVTKYRFKLIHNMDDDSKSIECSKYKPSLLKFPILWAIIIYGPFPYRCHHKRQKYKYEFIISKNHKIYQ